MEAAGVRAKLCVLAGATGPVSMVTEEGVAWNKCEPEGRGWSGTGRPSAAAGGRGAGCAVSCVARGTWGRSPLAAQCLGCLGAGGAGSISALEAEGRWRASKELASPDPHPWKRDPTGLAGREVPAEFGDR